MQEQGWRRPLAASLGFVLVALAIMAGALGVAVAMAIASLLSIPSLASLKRLLPLEFPVALFLIFIAWAWVSSAWSPVDHGQALRMVVGFPLYALFAWNVWSLRGKGRYLVLIVATMACVLAIAGFSIEAMTGIVEHLYPAGNPRQQMFRSVTRGASALAMFVPALWAFLWMLIPGWRGIAASVLAGLLVFVINWRVGLDAGMIAVLLAAIVYGVALAAPRTTILLVGLAGAGMVLLAPMLMDMVVNTLGAGRELPFSWEIRLENWRFALEKISEKPLFGWGLDAARSFNHTYEMRGYALPHISMHPHNVGLHIWLETGLIGVLLFTATLLIVAIRASTAPNLSRAQGATIAACFTAFLVFCGITYGAWQEWFWGMFGFLAALCVLVGPEPEEADAS